MLVHDLRGVYDRKIRVCISEAEVSFGLNMENFLQTLLFPWVNSNRVMMHLRRKTPT